MPRIELDPTLKDERFEQAEDYAQESGEVFDRIAFAARAVALVRPRGTTVAICKGRRHVRISCGKQWGSGPDARWAILSVPPAASRRAIASAVLGLGVGRARPWALDVLVRGASSVDLVGEG